MTIDQGERIGLVGASGSGKSSLLRAIARLDLCDEGSIVFRSEVVARDSIPTFRRQVIYLPQRPSLFATTVRENLQMPFRLAVSRARSDGVQSEQQDYDESIVTGILRGLGKPITILDQSAESLSGGEQQIVALIRALILRPVILLLDEPSASLDPETTQQLEKLVLDWHEPSTSDASSSPTAFDASVRDASVRDASVRDASVRDSSVRDASVRDARALVWTSHNPEQISRMTTRVVRIDHGKLQTGTDS